LKKSTKGALAAGTAALLLLGGAGSLAYWTGEGTVSGGKITSGRLALEPTTTPCTGWTLDGGDAFDPTTAKVVPGDTLTKSCSYTLTATGDHIAGTIEATQPTFTAADDSDPALASALTATAAVTDRDADDAPLTSFGPAQNGHVVDVALSVTLPEGTAVDNSTQGLAAQLAAITVTATQTHS